jgi:hypothetical protein
MPGPKPRYPDDVIADAVERHNGNQRAAAAELGVDASLISRRKAIVTVHEPPSEAIPLAELLERRRADFHRKQAWESASKLIGVDIADDQPIGLMLFGDPHLDDDGTNIELVERHIALCRETDGLYGIGIGDNTNNWVGRLAHLYAHQTAKKCDALTLAKWFFESVPWLFQVGGNHDLWSGDDSPLPWLAERCDTLYRPDGVRVALRFSNGREVRINSRHDFSGSSQWNPAHGPMKAAMMTWKDHIILCGHRHTNGYSLAYDAMTGVLSHAIRLGTYKQFDAYARSKGFPDGNFAPGVLAVVNPNAETETGLVTVFHEPEVGAKFLTMLRSKPCPTKPKTRSRSSKRPT